MAAVLSCASAGARGAAPRRTRRLRRAGVRALSGLSVLAAGNTYPPRPERRAPDHVPVTQDGARSGDERRGDREPSPPRRRALVQAAAHGELRGGRWTRHLVHRPRAAVARPRANRALARDPAGDRGTE